MPLMEIYDQYYPRVRRFIMNMVRNEWAADDLVQETFLRVNDNLENVRDTSNLSSWIFRIAYNLCQDHFRHQARSSSLSNEEIPEETTPSQDPGMHKELEQGQMNRCVRGLINHLPDSLRSVVILSDIDGFSQREIAEIVGITVENAKIRLHRGRKKLKLLLEKYCVFEVDERSVLTCVPVLTDDGKDEWTQALP